MARVIQSLAIGLFLDVGLQAQTARKQADDLREERARLAAEMGRLDSSSKANGGDTAAESEDDRAIRTERLAFLHELDAVYAQHQSRLRQLSMLRTSLDEAEP